MKQTRILMDMPITVEISGRIIDQKIFDRVFDYFKYIDSKFSTFLPSSEISNINNGFIKAGDYSNDMNTVLNLSDKTKKETDGYFDIFHDDKLDPSGLVKGWAIHNSAEIITKCGFDDFYIDAGGDIEMRGNNQDGNKWRIGIKNPFNLKEIVKVVCLSNRGIATSGSYIRGKHIYNPLNPKVIPDEIMSISVIGPDVFEADRFATAAFAMGKNGIKFIENRKNLEGYMIDKKGMATYTSGFEDYTTRACCASG